MVGMRKWILIALGVAAMGLTACRHLEQMDGPVCLTALMEGEALTKTSLSQAEGGAYNVLWSSSDKIGVYVDDGTTPVTFNLTEGAGSTKATFSGKGVGDQYLAVYPQSAFTSRSGNTFQVTLPTEQTYKQGNVSDGAYPMVAVGQSTVLPFKNLCSIIRLSLTGTRTVRRIVFRSLNPAIKLSGQASVDVSDPAAPVLTMASGACDSLVLNTGSVKLNQTTPTDFYLVVPAQTYGDGFSFRVYTTDGTYMEKERPASFTTVRSLLHKAGVLAFEPVIRAGKYLTFTSAGTTALSLDNFGDNAPLLYYSRDKKKWARWDYTELTFSASEPLYLCGDNPSGFSISERQHSQFASSGDSYSIAGSIMSLLDKDQSMTVIPNSYCFYRLFSADVMLVVAPELPATTLAASCYQEMFSFCSGLQSAPELPARTLATSCYQEMFSHCSGLQTAPELPATSLAVSCYQDMFSGCTGLQSAPELPAKTLADSCYEGMFNLCSDLQSAPELPAKTLAVSCYKQMFKDCTGIQTAPQLPATTLAASCYKQMFRSCTGLQSAPELPAKTLAASCYQEMFSGCDNLNYVRCLATSINATDCVTNWLSGVASEGTFVKDYRMESWPEGDSGIPAGWSIENGNVPYNDDGNEEPVEGGEIDL